MLFDCMGDLNPGRFCVIFVWKAITLRQLNTYIMLTFYSTQKKIIFFSKMKFLGWRVRGSGRGGCG